MVSRREYEKLFVRPLTCLPFKTGQQCLIATAAEGLLDPYQPMTWMEVIPLLLCFRWTNTKVVISAEMPKSSLSLLYRIEVAALLVVEKKMPHTAKTTIRGKYKIIFAIKQK